MAPNKPFKTMSNEEVLQFVGQMPGYGRHMVLEVIATSPGFCLVRTHYVNTESDEIFQQKEPFIELPLELMADKMGHVMLMVGSLQAQLQLKVDGPNEQECATLVDALTGLIKVFAAEYGIEIGAIQEAGAPADDIQMVQQEAMRQMMSLKASAGLIPGQNVILLKDPAEVKKFMAMLGSRTQNGGHSCGCPDCTGKR